MKKLALAIVALIWLTIGTAVSYSQTTSVTATITDSQSVAWANAPYTINFVGSQPGKPFTTSGQNFTQSFSGTANGSGQLSLTMTDVAYIIPQNSTWKFCVTPAVSAPLTYCVNIPVTGASEDVSSKINAVILPPAISGTGLANGYADSEVLAASGQMYYRNSDNTFRCYTTSWGPCAGTGTFSYPSGTGIVAVTGGTAWGTTYNAGNTIPLNFLPSSLFTLTTTGSSGAATYSGGTLNIPQYSGGGSSAFSALTGGTNSTAAMVVGTGASLLPSGTGSIGATTLYGGTTNDLIYQAGANTTGFIAAAASCVFGTSGSSVPSCLTTIPNVNLGTPTGVVLTNGTGLPLTTGVTGTLPIANGGTNATTAANALINLFPAASEVGDIVYCATYSSGCTSWAKLAGNTSGTQYLQETSGGVPSWTTPSGSGTVNSGTANHLAYYASSTNAVSNDATATDNGTTFGYSGTGGITASAGPLTGGGNCGNGTGCVSVPQGTGAFTSSAANTLYWGPDANGLLAQNPNATGNVEMVDLSHTQTLTNKTLTSPVINTQVTGTAVQGTDTKVLSAGTVSGTAATLCTDSNGGATTSGCSGGGGAWSTVSPAGNYINPATTQYFPLSGYTNSLVTSNFINIGSQPVGSDGCTLQSMSVVIGAAQTANGSLTIKIYHVTQASGYTDGSLAATAITVTIPASSPAGEYFATGLTAVTTAGDLYFYGGINTASTFPDNSAPIQSVKVFCQ